MLAESQILEDEILSGTEGTDNPAEKLPEQKEHGPNCLNLIGTLASRSLELIYSTSARGFDEGQASFVSVTQQFNTTTSMGRLTLNILLSFAQFEREVTGERIRDKIAASKKKGMWMGGLVPLGYDLEDRKLVPNPKEVALVSKIFSLYVEMGCVRKLAERLDREEIRSKVWTTRIGARLGGVAFARGALYDLLRNRLYIGEIRHRDQWYPGEHQGIVFRALWDGVQP